MAGRRPLPPAETVGEEIGKHLTPQAAAEEAAGHAIDQAILDQGATMVRTGRIQAYQFVSKLGRVAAVREFQTIRDSGGYKGVAYRDKEGNLRHTVDLDEYCEVFLGRSYKSLYEDAKNLNVLGEELYEGALSLGLTSRDFRDIRRLPPTEQELVKEAIEAKSREQVIEIMESLVAKHAKEKETLAKQITSLSADLEASRKIAAKRAEEKHALEEQLHRKETLPDDELNEAQFHELERAASGVAAEMLRLRKVMNEITARNEVPEHLRAHMSNMLSYCVQQLLKIRDDFTLPVNIEEEVFPSWLEQIDPEAHARMGRKKAEEQQH